MMCFKKYLYGTLQEVVQRDETGWAVEGGEWWWGNWLSLQNTRWAQLIRCVASVALITWEQ